MTFDELCESMGWDIGDPTVWSGDQGDWWYKSGTLMATNRNLTAAGAIAVQGKYKMTTHSYLKNGFSVPGMEWCCLYLGGDLSAFAKDIPTAIRDCAMEIKK